MSWMMLEFVCPCGVRFESLEKERPTTMTHSCGAEATRAISAPKMATIWAAAATTGKSEPPPNLSFANTQSIADGETVGSWKRGRRKMRRDIRRQQIADNA